ncbi:hypothetical protein SUGI_0045290 [Cryptomeria japonica]|nr:hypothetical protein SUGI_0045290 [Cryptomeria japonica]
MVTNNKNACFSCSEDFNGEAEGQPAASVRWNPTREQIAILESLYSQGIRTPTAQQIQQITSRLRMYGNIEGKNVFYWFQNHKARERQKEKQQKLIYFNQFFPSSQENAFAGSTNIGSDSYISMHSPINGLSKEPETSMLMAERQWMDPNTMPFNRSMSLKSDNLTGETSSNHEEFLSLQMDYTHSEENQHGFCTSNERETLQLFPLHPGVSAMNDIQEDTSVSPPKYI